VIKAKKRPRLREQWLLTWYLWQDSEWRDPRRRQRKGRESGEERWERRGDWGRRLADREEGHFLNHIFWGREKEREEEEEERPSEVTDWAGMPGCGYADD
jgi:hypothetical protein